jgi:hypothetical protein
VRSTPDESTLNRSAAVAIMEASRYIRYLPSLF